MIYLTSDHHFGHHNVIEYCGRPYKDVYHMNQDMIDRWNSIVSPSDHVVYLGDFCMNPKYYGILKNLNRKSIDIYLGNHDLGFPNKPKKIERLLEFGFDSVHLHGELEISPGVVVNLSHMPYKGSGDRSYTERYTDQRLEDDGRPLLCGHVHEKWKTKDKMINVGVDVWDFYPVSLDQIKELVNVTG
jgi:calcineurin-like phosphoesterase family protein